MPIDPDAIVYEDGPKKARYIHRAEGAEGYYGDQDLNHTRFLLPMDEGCLELNSKIQITNSN